VAAGGVHEQLERVERARGGSRRLDRRGRADDDVALVECGDQGGELVLGELVLVGERLELALLDEAALGGLLEQALGRRQIVQMNRVAQWNPLPGVRGPRPSRARRPRRAGVARDMPVGPSGYL
jgi:hypothetical protein